jgi:hypothetical protein
MLLDARSLQRPRVPVCSPADRTAKLRSLQAGDLSAGTEINRMRVHHFTRFFACLAIGLAIPSDSCGSDLEPYALPPEARTAIEKLAADSDVLILGEFHGTQEVPQLVAGLLSPLTELGYHTLAIEVPNNHQAAVRARALGETEAIPDFFANPNGDGRGNAQLRSTGEKPNRSGNGLSNTPSSDRQVSRDTAWC